MVLKTSSKLVGLVHCHGEAVPHLCECILLSFDEALAEYQLLMLLNTTTSSTWPNTDNSIVLFLNLNSNE